MYILYKHYPSLVPPHVSELLLGEAEYSYTISSTIIIEQQHQEFRQLMEGPLLHTLEPSRLTVFNRVFAAVYACAVVALLCHRSSKLIHSTAATLPSISISLCMLISDLLLAFMWAATQAFRMRPIHRKEFPDNLVKTVKESDFPALDVFICTSDPHKEPPMSVANTALSVMAYDYPAEKISVYVSDDGGSQLTLFAFMEAAKFATHWLPFCRKNNVVERSPEAYFASSNSWSSEMEAEKIKVKHTKLSFYIYICA
jgi:hypothetical protein